MNRGRWDEERRELERENEALRDRLSRLSEASLRINESLDLRDGVAGLTEPSVGYRMEEGEGPEWEESQEVSYRAVRG